MRTRNSPMKHGYILISAIALVVILSSIALLSLKTSALNLASIANRALEIKAELFLKASKGIVLDEILNHDYNKSCLNSFTKELGDGEFIANYELKYSQSVGLCASWLGTDTTNKSLIISVTASISSTKYKILIRKRKIFSLKI